VYPARGGFWNAVDRMRLLAAHTNLNHTGIVLHKLSDGLPTQSPYACELPYTVVLFKWCGVSIRHGASP
jgi:hypothetical protein